MISTSTKIAFGYILLIGILIGSVKYIYQQMGLLSERTETESLINDRRQTTHKIVSKLYEIEIIGQTLPTGKASAYRNFNKKMQEVQLDIDTLQAQLTDTLQYHRLDTLRALLRYKSNNVRAVAKALQRTPADKIYKQQFDSLLTQQDSLINSSHIRRRVITHHNSYTIHNKPKGFFKRVANVFAPEKADSVEVNNIVQEEIVDTLEEAYNPIDTIASMLTDIHSKVLETREQELRTLDSHVNRLRIAGNDLSRRVNQLLETIEREEQEAARQKILQESNIRHRAAWTMAAISIMAVVLVIVFFTIIWRDLTRSNHYRRELEKAKLYAENLLVAREKLMLTITHDIKAPAGSIIGYLDLLNRLVTDKRQQFYLSNMQSAAHHLLNLVTSLLDFHRLEAGKMDLNPVSFKPYQLLEDIYHCFLPLSEKKQLAFNLQLDMPASLTLEGDPFRLRQIVENLLSNALKFTEEGTITLQSNYQGNQFIIRVSDTGCGMTEEEKQRIFKEFTRLHSAQGQEGFGLGLSITRKLIDLQHGKICVDSIPRVGSTFEVAIPLPSFGLHPERGKESASKESAGDTAKETDRQEMPANQPLRILAIDDDQIQLQLTEAMLHHAAESANADIHCSTQPEEILQMLQEGDRPCDKTCENPCDILFTDIQMPAMNGFELLNTIRNLPDGRGKQIAVVAITARGDIDEEGFKEKGFAAMLQKPFNLSDLRKVLQEVASKKLQQSEYVCLNEQHEHRVQNEQILHQNEHSTQNEQHELNNNKENQQFTFNFAPLLAFTDGDEEAAHEILSTFIQETEKHIILIEQAIASKDYQRLCEIGHKMLPTFTMIEAGEAVSALQWLDAHRKADFNQVSGTGETSGPIEESKTDKVNNISEISNNATSIGDETIQKAQIVIKYAQAVNKKAKSC